MNCYVHAQEKKKLDPRSEKGLILGCDEYSPVYFVYFPETNQIKKIRCVVFSNEFLWASEDAHEANCDDGYCFRAIPTNEIAEQIELGPKPNRNYPVRERRSPYYFCNVTKHDYVNVDFCHKIKDLPLTYTKTINSSEYRKMENYHG